MTTRQHQVLTAIPVVLTLAAGLLVGLSPAPAAAAERTITDRRGDTAHPADIVRVRVEHGDRVVVAVTHLNLTFRDAPAVLRVVYDTGPRDVGPDFYLRVVYQSDQAPELRLAHGWADLHDPPIASCHGERVRVRPGLDRTRISVPRSCFGNPKRVRVHVRMAPYPDDDRKPDVAPGVRTLGPWVAHSG